MINIYLSIYLYISVRRWVEIYDIFTHPHTKHTHRHNDNILPKLVFGSEEFATSLSFPRFPNFFWNNCLRKVLLCFLGTRKHSSNYSLFFWGRNYCRFRGAWFRWVSLGPSLVPPPSCPPGSRRKLPAEPSVPSIFALSFHSSQAPSFPTGEALFAGDPSEVWIPGWLLSPCRFWAFPHLVSPFLDDQTRCTSKSLQDTAN